MNEWKCQQCHVSYHIAEQGSRRLWRCEVPGCRLRYSCHETDIGGERLLELRVAPADVPTAEPAT